MKKTPPCIRAAPESRGVLIFGSIIHQADRRPTRLAHQRSVLQKEEASSYAELQTEDYSSIVKSVVEGIE